MAKKCIISRPGLVDMVYYYDENGKPLGKSRPGLLGDTRVYTDQNGRRAGVSRPGFLAKKVFTDAEHDQITSYDGLCGENLFQNGVPVGYTRPGILDVADTVLETEEPAKENQVEDEMLDGTDCEEYAPEGSRRSVLRNLKFFALSLIICGIIACIYVIIKFL